MTKREDISGFNNRFSKLRFRGQQGADSANSFPLEGQSVSKALTNNTGNFDTATTIPADSTIEGVGLVLTAVYDAGTTITCGTAIAPTYLCDDTVFDLVTAPGSFYETVEKAWATAVIARAVIANGGGVTIGGGTVTYYYTV